MAGQESGWAESITSHILTHLDVTCTTSPPISASSHGSSSLLMFNLGEPTTRPNSTYRQGSVANDRVLSMRTRSLVSILYERQRDEKRLHGLPSAPSYCQLLDQSSDSLAWDAFPCIQNSRYSTVLYCTVRNKAGSRANQWIRLSAGHAAARPSIKRPTRHHFAPMPSPYSIITCWTSSRDRGVRHVKER